MLWLLVALPSAVTTVTVPVFAPGGTSALNDVFGDMS
jgi:hypothetical protein